LATKASDESLKARLKALKDLMTNHHHEEEHDLFPKVRRLMSDATLEKLGAKMPGLFNANVERGHEAVLATFDDALRKPGARGNEARSDKKPADTSPQTEAPPNSPKWRAPCTQF
jgi:hypothetical protein